MKHLSGAPFYGRLLALPTNITLGWKINVVEKHSSLLRKFVNYGRKKFYNIWPWSSQRDHPTLIFVTKKTRAKKNYFQLKGWNSPNLL